MSVELSAEELLVRVVQHDADALSELYDRYAPRVYGMVAHILPARESAEEVLQEVFVRLWSESAGLRREGNSVAAWLVVTAREGAIGRVRTLRKNAANTGPQVSGVRAGKEQDHGARRSKPAVLPSFGTRPLEGKTASMKPRPADAAGIPPTGAVPPAWLPLPKEISLIDDRLVLLHKVIDQLPKPQRQALELAVFGGLSESEIAAEIGEPLGKVQRSLRAAVTFVKHRRRAVCGTWAANI
jgi:RNA polymerase sigma-70 factor, ECF subfamily